MKRHDWMSYKWKCYFGCGATVHWSNAAGRPAVCGDCADAKKALMGALHRGDYELEPCALPDDRV